MIDPQRQAYLEAMGFDVWMAKPPAPERDRLLVGSGQGSTLLVSESPPEHNPLLASDIARAVGGDPVWAWSDPEGHPDNPRLADAVERSLFTRLVVFGDSLAARLMGKDRPAVLGSAAVLVSEPLEDLAVNGTAKKRLWNALSGPVATAPENTTGER
jgi:DNA polymerase III psi subunit